jgi:DNA-binding MurR/RpiR family transcriptional regulator
MDHNELHRLIVARHGELAPVLRRIAEFAVEHPNDIALKPVTTIAATAGVHPSALVRFAKAFGFDGFSELKRVFQGRLTEQRQSYQDRLARLPVPNGGAQGRMGDAGALLQTFAEAGKAALDHLAAETDRAKLDAAIGLLARARAIYILGQRRSFAVAAYLNYALGQADERVVLLDGIGGMIEQQSWRISRGDVLLATSFSPYSPETLDIAERARGNGAKVIAITDRQISPLARTSDIALDVAEAEVMNFRSLTATLCLAQTIVIGVAERLAEKKRGRRAVKPEPSA